MSIGYCLLLTSEENSYLRDKANWKNTRAKKWQASVTLGPGTDGCTVTCEDDPSLSFVSNRNFVFTRFKQIGSFNIDKPIKMEYIPTGEKYMACFLPPNVLKEVSSSLRSHCEQVDPSLSEGVYLVATGDSFETIKWFASMVLSVSSFKVCFDLRAFSGVSAASNISKYTASQLCSTCDRSKDHMDTFQRDAEAIVRNFSDLSRSFMGIILNIDEQAFLAWAHKHCKNERTLGELALLPYVLKEFYQRASDALGVPLKREMKVGIFSEGYIGAVIKDGVFIWTLEYDTNKSVESYCQVKGTWFGEAQKIELMTKSELYVMRTGESEAGMLSNLSTLMRSRFSTIMSRFSKPIEAAQDIVDTYNSIALENHIKIDIPAEIDTVALLRAYVEHKCLVTLMRTFLRDIGHNSMLHPFMLTLYVRPEKVYASVYAKDCLIRLEYNTNEYRRNGILCYMYLTLGESDTAGLRIKCGTAKDVHLYSTNPKKAEKLVQPCFNALYKKSVERGICPNLNCNEFQEKTNEPEVVSEPNGGTEGTVSRVGVKVKPVRKRNK